MTAESPEYEIAGIWEPDQQLAAKFTQAGYRMLKLDEILNDRSIVAVAVESGVAEHASHAKAALAAGKHVHVEKPPTTTMAEMRELVRLARERDRLMQMGYMWRYHPAVNTALEAARNGWLGKVYMVRGTINTSIPDAGRKDLARFKGGMMFELGAHLIDAVVRLMGKPSEVKPMLREHGSQGDGLKDNTVAVFAYPEALAMVQSAAMQPRAFAHRAFEIIGTNGAAVLRPIEPPALQIDLATAAGPYRAGVNNVPSPPYQRYVEDFANFAVCIRGKARLPVKLEDELVIQEALLAASEML